MTTELSYRNVGANVYAQDGTLVCIAVDPLDAEVLAGLLRWKVDVTPDPWPTDDLIVADWIATGTAKGRGLAYLDGHEYVTVESGHVLRYGRDTLTNVVPVRVVPVAEWEALVEKVRSFDAARTDNQWRVVTARAAELLVAATDALGVDL